MADTTSAAEGPVLNLLSKRLRGLKKKYNRIVQMEEAVAQGKPLNKEQQDVLRSKPAIETLIDEYEKLRSPLSLAVQEELELSQKFHAGTPSPPVEEAHHAHQAPPSPPLEDLLTLLYFAHLFDVMPQSDFTSTMLTRTHERECCLTYDYVTDDTAADLLAEGDLDLISMLGGLVIARPANSALSHQNALQTCVEHARLWLDGSDRPIQPGSSISYAGLRDRLKRILSSDYFTTTPEMKAPVDVAAAAEKYAQVPVHETTVPPPAAEAEGVAETVHDQQKDEETEDFQGSEAVTGQPTSTEKFSKDNVEMLMPGVDDIQHDQSNEQVDTEEQIDGDGDGDGDGDEGTEQQYIPRRAFQNRRVGGRGGGRRGYPNGRGGRVGRGGGNYQNGRANYYDSGSYFLRNYHNARGRGGGRGAGQKPTYNNYSAAAHNGHEHVTA